MREVIFRGKTEKGEWVYGVPTKDDFNSTYIVEGIFECDEYRCNGADCFDVDENTVGQYTGLTDKTGTKIFEGDIVKIHYDSAIWGNNREVVFEEGQWFFKDNTISQKSYIGAWGNSVVEVIGNIHDNPELLEGSGDNTSLANKNLKE